MTKTQPARVQVQSGLSPISPIQKIADNGTPQTLGMGTMNPQLMGATGLGSEFEQGAFFGTLDDAVMGDPHHPMDGIIDLTRPSVGVQSESQTNFALLGYHRALDPCVIGF